MLPNRIKLSKKATDKLRAMKAQTGLTPNILARIAIMLALKEEKDFTVNGVPDIDGQELNQSVLFGDQIQVYDILIRQYIDQWKIGHPIQGAISSLVDAGVHKIGHVKSLYDIANIK